MFIPQALLSSAWEIFLTMYILYNPVLPSEPGITTMEIIISISAFSENERVKIRVRDNGVGMSQEECRLLNEDLKSAYQTKEGHIGVRNVGQRLKLILGDAAEMSLRSAVGEGTTVTISLPLHFVEIDTEKQGEHG